MPLPPAATPFRPLAPRTPFWRKLPRTRAGRALTPRCPALNAKHGPVCGRTPAAARAAARFGRIGLVPPPGAATPCRPLLPPRAPFNAERGPAGGSRPSGGLSGRPRPTPRPPAVPTWPVTRPPRAPWREVWKDLRGPPAVTDRALAPDLVRFGSLIPAGRRPRVPLVPSGYPLPPAFGVSFLRPLAATPCRQLLAPSTPLDAKNSPEGGGRPAAAGRGARRARATPAAVRASLAPRPAATDPARELVRFPWPALGVSCLRPLAATPCRPLSAPRAPFNVKNGPAGGSRRPARPAATDPARIGKISLARSAQALSPRARAPGAGPEGAGSLWLPSLAARARARARGSRLPLAPRARALGSLAPEPKFPGPGRLPRKYGLALDF